MQVDLTLSGHVHLYSRTCSVFKKVCLERKQDGSERGPVHAIIGNGGQWLTYFVSPEIRPYIMRVEVAHGYLVYTVNRTDLHAEVGPFFGQA